ncbi:hypothetical protein S40293_11228 [Stachybotrys chartarum IBT 40293]|nr:hypothetical protein S40293_11228 [Stachybotrys chartarum IBT 40293]
MVGSATYTDEEIIWVLDQVIHGVKKEVIFEGYAVKFPTKGKLTKNKLRYIKTKYGKSAKLGSPLINNKLTYDRTRRDHRARLKALRTSMEKSVKTDVKPQLEPQVKTEELSSEQGMETLPSAGVTAGQSYPYVKNDDMLSPEIKESPLAHGVLETIECLSSLDHLSLSDPHVKLSPSSDSFSPNISNNMSFPMADWETSPPFMDADSNLLVPSFGPNLQGSAMFEPQPATLGFPPPVLPAADNCYSPSMMGCLPLSRDSYVPSASSVGVEFPTTPSSVQFTSPGQPAQQYLSENNCLMAATPHDTISAMMPQETFSDYLARADFRDPESSAATYSAAAAADAHFQDHQFAPASFSQPNVGTPFSHLSAPRLPHTDPEHAVGDNHQWNQACSPYAFDGIGPAPSMSIAPGQSIWAYSPESVPSTVSDLDTPAPTADPQTSPYEYPPENSLSPSTSEQDGLITDVDTDKGCSDDTHLFSRADLGVSDRSSLPHVGHHLRGLHVSHLQPVRTSDFGGAYIGADQHQWSHPPLFTCDIRQVDIVDEDTHEPSWRYDDFVLFGDE